MSPTGINYEPGSCFLCEAPLGAIEGLTRVPIFWPAADGVGWEFVQYIKKAVHRACWESWASRDFVAEMAIRTKADEFENAHALVLGRCVGAWAHAARDVHFAHGTIFLPRSSMIFDNLLGPDVEACEIRGRTSNIEELLEVIRRGQLAPGFKHLQPRQGQVPELEIGCDESEGTILEVRLKSSHKYGINLTCFLLHDDLEMLQAHL